jgi:predicted P-loop ATPase/GTPase
VVALEAVSAVALAAWTVVGGHNVWQAWSLTRRLAAPGVV